MDSIEIHGAREHNLKNIHLHIKKNALTVVTGPSGSGKTSLVFHTLYAEAQRRFFEASSLQAKRLFEQLPHPAIDFIQGLIPAIGLRSDEGTRSQRSTLGTLTHIADYLKVLFVRLGEVHCPTCHKKLFAKSSVSVFKTLLEEHSEEKIFLSAPLGRFEKESFMQRLAQLRCEGFVRIMVDGDEFRLDEDTDFKKFSCFLEVVVDRVTIKENAKQRIIEAVDLCYKLAAGQVVAHQKDSASIYFSNKFMCSDHGLVLEALTPQLFSFNHPEGACSFCQGLGVEKKVAELEDENEEKVFAFSGSKECKTCHGMRLNAKSNAVQIADQSMGGVGQVSLHQLLDWLEKVALLAEEVELKVVEQIRLRLKLLFKLQLSYLSLNRSSTTLSTGEFHRARLCSLLSSNLSGVLYALDEPSRGLHPKDALQLLEVLQETRDAGNAVLLVEHQETLIRGADQIIDLGPGAGDKGGEVVAQGQLSDIQKIKNSPTGDFFTQRFSLNTENPMDLGDPLFSIKGARVHNLKNVDVSIPKGRLTCISGPSGSGKTSLLMGAILYCAKATINHQSLSSSVVDSCEGFENIHRLIDVSATPLGKTPHSCPATYTSVFTALRSLYSSLPEAKARGYRPSRFSFNTKEGRCESCQGHGGKYVELYLLPPTYVVCELCQGKRYKESTLEVRFKGYSIADALALSAVEAFALFETIPQLRRALQTLCDVGLGYLSLGRNALTLSGGESQRVKIAKELSKNTQSKKAADSALFLLDEPSAGLHFQDVELLLKSLHKLIEQGHTVIVADHHFTLLNAADYVIDLGPEGGDAGGQVVAQGSLSDLMAVQKSATGQWLNSYETEH